MKKTAGIETQSGRICVTPCRRSILKPWLTWCYTQPYQDEDGKFKKWDYCSKYQNQTIHVPLAKGRILVLEIGWQCLRDYQLRDILRRGGFGFVYYTCTLKNNCNYVVKVVFLHNQAHKDMFDREAAFSAQFSKPLGLPFFSDRIGAKHYLSTTCGLGCTDRNHCYSLTKSNVPPLAGFHVFERLGYTLSNLGKGNVSVKLARKLKKKIIEMHRQHVVHSDLFGKNIMVTRDRKNLYLIDWGMAFNVDLPMNDFRSVWAMLDSKHNGSLRAWWKEVVTDYHFSYSADRSLSNKEIGVWFYSLPAEHVVRAVTQFGALEGLTYDFANPMSGEILGIYLERIIKRSELIKRHAFLLDWAIYFAHWSQRSIRLRISEHNIKRIYVDEANTLIDVYNIARKLKLGLLVFEPRPRKYFFKTASQKDPVSYEDYQGNMKISEIQGDLPDESDELWIF